MYTSAIIASIFRRTPLCRLALLVLLLSSYRVCVAQTNGALRILESTTAFPSPEALVEVRNAQGQVLNNIKPEQFTVLQDGQPVLPDDIRVSTQQLETKGPTLGIVLDASTLLGASEVEAARSAAVALVQAGGALKATDPEVVTLFVPAGDPQQPSQVPDFATFTHDHNAVVNYLNTRLELQAGTTRLYAVIHDAIETVAEQATQRGTPGYIAIFSDGQDSLSVDAYVQALAAAREHNVTVLAFGFGNQDTTTKGVARLNQLATETQGVYINHPTPSDVANAYSRLTSTTVHTAYRVSYTSSLPADEQPHSWQIITIVDGTELRSQQLLFQAALPAQPIRSLNTVMNAYLLRAVPAVVIISGLLTLIVALWQRSGREDSRRLQGGLNTAATIKRPSSHV